jgi:mono/diheme cytochrome c family protein
MKYKTIAFVLAAVAFAVVVFVNLNGQSERAPADQATSVRTPPLSDVAARGKVAFDANCATCHGANASGTDQGPPLVHDIYNPGHHADGAFFLAAKLGVRQHHWPFGNMPPQPQVTEVQVAEIVRYVRELQIANGITYRPHRM